MHTSSNHTHPERDHSGEIGQLAYHLWQSSGSPSGQDVHFWLQAERQLLGPNHRGPAKKAASSPSSKTAGSMRPVQKRLRSSRVKTSADA